MDLIGRVNILRAQRSSKELSVSTAADLLDVNRTSAYYTPAGPSEQELAAKNLIDRLHTDNPAWGSRQLSKQLKKKGLPIGRLKTRRYMQEMGISVIYPKPNLSKPAKGNKIYPYLLRNAVITRPNQAWSIDITYIKLHHGFVYLTAIIDWYSRCIVGWELDDTLATPMVLRALEKAFKTAKPRNSQFRSGQSIYWPRLYRIRGKERSKNQHGRQKPLGRQHYDRTLVPHPEI